MKRALFLLCLIALLCGCSNYPINPNLEKYDKTQGYRFDNLAAEEGADRLFVILTFSGGGTRAAALSYGVLETLRDTQFHWQGAQRSLLDEVDVISSVSGGSFTAACYALFRDDMFQSFEDQFLYRDVQGELLGQVMMPTNWLKLMSPNYSRIDLAAEFYSREIFQKKQYADLIQQNQRPLIILNATDLSIGMPFTFTQSQFDTICSDLSGVEIGRAVAASSCFPVAFPPMTMNNYAGTCQYEEPAWVALALEDLEMNPPRYARARALQSYYDAEQRPFLHLLDGGVSDNIGLRGPLASIRSNDPELSIVRRINRGLIDHLVVIVVDAKTKQSSKIDKKASPPGLKTVLAKISTVPLDNYSFDTVQALQDAFNLFEKESRNYEDCKHVLASQCDSCRMPYDPPRKIKLFPIYVGFDHIEDEKRRSYFQTMDTSFHLPKQQVTDLRKIAKSLLEGSEKFQELKQELNAVGE